MRFEAYCFSSGCMTISSCGRNCRQPFRISCAETKKFRENPEFSSFAESMRFELMRALRPYLVSSEALSTTQPTLLHFVQESWLSVVDKSSTSFQSDKIVSHTILSTQPTLQMYKVYSRPPHRRCTPCSYVTFGKASKHMWQGLAKVSQTFSLKYTIERGKDTIFFWESHRVNAQSRDR